MDAEITIILADDHPLMRAGVRDALRSDPTLKLVGEAGNGADALRLIETLRPAIAVLDINMPGMTGLDVAKVVKERSLPTRIALLTMHDGADMLHRALDVGVLGYLLKDSAVTDIIACVHTIATGKPYVTAAMSAHLVAGASRAQADPLAPLTAAERRIVELVLQGKSSKEIARTLGLKAKTVENHRSNACARLGLSGNNALMKFALEHRLVFR